MDVHERKRFAESHGLKWIKPEEVQISEEAKKKSNQGEGA